MRSLHAAALLLALSSFAARGAPDWSKDAKVPPDGRANPYGLDDNALAQSVRDGRLHALVYPVSATATRLPYQPLVKLLQRPKNDLLKRKFLDAFQMTEDVPTPNDLYAWLGLQPYPAPGDTGVYAVPYPDGQRPGYPMGVTYHDVGGTRGITFSCAACHAGSLFGKRVLGLSTRFPRANRFFHQAKGLTEQVSGFLFQLTLSTTKGERVMYEVARENLRFVSSRLPQALGLDTSLAHTALSLAHRAPDGVATKDPRYAQNPDPDPLSERPADSKPSVWWTLKYKNRWLSDGSVVSGNPIFTNFIWNEIGRGSDLTDVERWLAASEPVVTALTTAVFATQPPRFTDFFPAESVDLAAAKRGEILFAARCTRCHGTYAKGWSKPGAAALPLAEQLATTEVRYHERTPVVDVGTDPLRWQGMTSLAKRLNPLDISKKNAIVIEPQQGYVPPPLVGVWARWPYFHNNAAPSLCAVLTRHEARPKTYVAGEAVNPATDFDRRCNGYPAEAAAPAAWKSDPERRYDTTRAGMGNGGHDEGIFLENGAEVFTAAEKADLVVFLQTL